MALETRDFKPRQGRPVPARYLAEKRPNWLNAMLDNAQTSLAEPFKGVTTDGNVVPGLFSIGGGGGSNQGAKDAANAFISALGAEQRAAAQFPLDSDAWRQWSNIHQYMMRHGALLESAGPAQRDLALAVLRESLSPSGFTLARDVMKLNESILEITGSTEEFGEWLYWMSILGTPSLEEPWGWQIDGHHLIINFFVVGDQIVATPTFMGSEPVAIETGKYAGTRVFEAEERAGLTLAQSLTKEQRSKAVLSESLPRDVFTSAYRDNFEMRYEGIKYGDLASGQQSLLLDVVATYLGRLRLADALAKTEEVRRHLNETYFAWMGGTDAESVFYYRIHSPVILIEFDHQAGIALDNSEPTRNHIHTVMRTPNGNDYGKDLLRQHREQVGHGAG